MTFYCCLEKRLYYFSLIKDIKINLEINYVNVKIVLWFEKNIKLLFTLILCLSRLICHNRIKNQVHLLLLINPKKSKLKRNLIVLNFRSINLLSLNHNKFLPLKITTHTILLIIYLIKYSIITDLYRSKLRQMGKKQNVWIFSNYTFKK